MNRLSGILYDGIKKKAIISALKEQDKITRHACADEITKKFGEQVYDSPGHFCDAARNAVVNTK
jgi:hypothetical protein